MITPRRAVALIASSAILAIMRCHEQHATIPPSGPATLSLSVSSNTVVMAPGTLTSVTAFVTRGGSFTGPVQLTAHGVPPEVHVAFARRTIHEGENATAVNVQLYGDVRGGVYPLVIVARGDGVDEQHLLVELIIRTESETHRRPLIRRPGLPVSSLAMHTSVPSPDETTSALHRYHGIQDHGIDGAILEND